MSPGVRLLSRGSVVQIWTPVKVIDGLICHRDKDLGTRFIDSHVFGTEAASVPFKGGE